MNESSENEGKHDGNWNVLIAGLPCPNDAVTLAPGISLRALGQPLSVFDLAAAGVVGFRRWSIIESIAGECLSEIETAKDAAMVPGYDTLNRAWLASALLVLRGFTRHFCVACNSYSWRIIAGHQKRTSKLFKQQIEAEGAATSVYLSNRDLPRFRGDVLDFHLRFITNDSAKTGPLADEDAEWIRRNFEIFNRLAAGSESFRFALEAAIDWRFAKDKRSAVARLWGGIEALFGITSELVYRLALLSSSLLAERGNARKEKFQEVKKLYGLRSKVVHGEMLSDEKIASALNDSFQLLADLLLLTIDKGHVLGSVDFDEAVFG